MYISVNKNKKTISLNVDFLLSFINKNGKGLKFKKVNTGVSSENIKSLYLRLDTDKIYSGYNIEISGNANVCSNSTVPYVEITKKVNKIKNAVVQFHKEICAEGAVYAYILCKTQDIDRAMIRIRFSLKNGESILYEYTGEASDFKKITESLVSRALPFAEILADKEIKGYEAMRLIPFPYKTIRAGQREFIEEAFRTIKNSSSLMISAPTGTGKTISALYPAVKAVGSRKADKIFYLTSKTVINEEAVKVSRLISKYAPTLRTLSLRSKEALCPEKSIVSHMPCRYSCQRHYQAFYVSSKSTNRKVSIDQRNQASYNNTIPQINEFDKENRTSLPYYERFNTALYEILCASNIYTEENIISTADKYSVCPYELSLSVSDYCDIIICDYNYVFSPNTRLKRFFDKIDEKYIFLIDEAHNLPERIRENYSSKLSLSLLKNAKSSICETYEDKSLLLNAIDKLNAEFEKLSKECEKNGIYSKIGVREGYYKSSTPPDSLISASKGLIEIIKKEIISTPEIYTQLSEFLAELSSFINIAAISDNKFTFLAELSKSCLDIKIICIDPSDIINDCLSFAVSSILFSATLSPIEYYAEILKIKKSQTLIIDSPFDTDNLCLVAFDGLDTTAGRRNNTINEAAEIIECTICSKPGNYIVYFPSYEYMKKAASVFCMMNPDIKCIIQKRSMSNAAKKDFLSNFTDSPQETTVGFALIGGIFSEGIDLTGERLIGVIVFGTGMPAISSENNIIKEYYDNLNESGQEFAYTYPGLNNVIQAVGRVIRNENDKGIAVLADNRYKDRTLQHAFPDSWRKMKFTSDIDTLGILLERFWYD